MDPPILLSPRGVRTIILVQALILLPPSHLDVEEFAIRFLTVALYDIKDSLGPGSCRQVCTGAS